MRSFLLASTLILFALANLSTAIAVPLLRLPAPFPGDAQDRRLPECKACLAPECNIHDYFYHTNLTNTVSSHPSSHTQTTFTAPHNQLKVKFAGVEDMFTGGKIESNYDYDVVVSIDVQDATFLETKLIKERSSNSNVLHIGKLPATLALQPYLLISEAGCDCRFNLFPEALAVPNGNVTVYTTFDDAL